MLVPKGFVSKEANMEMFHLVTNRELLRQSIEPIIISIKMGPGNEVLK